MKRFIRIMKILGLFLVLLSPWSLIESYAQATNTATFNFNAMSVPTSSNTSSDGDITQDLAITEGAVIMTISPKDENTTFPNRFWSWNGGAQLRMYSNKLTFEVPNNYVLNQIKFTYVRWNDGNSFDSGEYASGTWIGKAQKVILSIAGNTQIDVIECFYEDTSKPKAVAPSFERQGNELVMSTSTPSASILYTLDGSMPTVYSSKYENPLSISQNGVVKAIAVADGYNNSDVSEYIVDWYTNETEKPYALLSNDNKVLTFYYDNQKELRNGMDVGPFTFNNSEGVNSGWYGSRENISTVVFDASFAICKSITSTAYWFDGCSKLEKIIDIDNLKTENVTDMSSMFYGCSSLKSLDLRSLNTDNVSNMMYLFYGCANLVSLSISNFNTTNVLNMHDMFYGCSSLTTINASSFDTGNVVDMGFMFAYCTKLSTIFVGNMWNTTKITESKNMFSGCSNLVGGNGTPYDSNYTNHAYAHIDGGPSNPGYLTDISSIYSESAATPIISNNDNVISISSTTEESTIYYTLDGSTPTVESKRYIGPVSLTQNCIVKAFAVAAGYKNSEVVSYSANWIRRGMTISWTDDPILKDEYSNGDFKVTRIDEFGRHVIDDNNAYFGDTDKQIGFTRRLKTSTSSKLESNCLELTIPAYGTLLVYVRSANSSAIDRNLVLTQNDKEIYNQIVKDEDCLVIDMSDYCTATKVYPIVQVPVEQGNVTVTYPIGGLNFYCFEFVDGGKTIDPVFTRNGNQVSITTSTEDATIYYTLDGSEPTTQSSVYTNSITLNQNCIIKAFAVKEGLSNSAVSSYIVDWFKVEDVAISFVNLKVQMSTPTANARIYYTTDGSTPTTNSQLYIEPFSVTVNCMVKAIAHKENFNPSTVSSLYVDLDKIRCDMPTFQLNGSQLTMSVQTEDATIYYTLDGTNPTTSSPRYEGPVTLLRNGWVKAIAVKNGYLASAVSSFEVNYFQVELPSFSSENKILTISCGTNGAAIYYVIGEGDLEITEKNRYTTPITLVDNSLVRAVGVLDGYRNSEEAVYKEGSFTCKEVAISYNGRLVTLTSDEPNAVIYYTTNGSNPTSESLLYSEPFALDNLCTVNAVATKQNMNNSGVARKEIGYLYDGETAVVREAGQLSKAFEWQHGAAINNRLVVKGPLNVADLGFVNTLSSIAYLDLKETTIEGGSLPKDIFANMNIVSVELPAGLAQPAYSLFKGCRRLAAVIWNSNTRFTEEALSDISNPNMLLYVNNLSNTGRTTNVVSMSTNKAFSIVLQDVNEGNGNFYCPRQFRAEQISYTRNFHLESGKKSCAGWETIALPFNVATVTHETNGQLSPFGSSVPGTKPFWLYSMQQSGFSPAVELVANTPYIISMPNHPDYADEYNQKGNVVFAAINVDVPVTNPVVSRQVSPVTAAMIPAFSTITSSDEIFAINKEAYENYAAGSLFVRGLRDIRPFEAYLTTDDNGSGLAPLYIPIEDQIPTGIQDIVTVNVDSRQIKVYNLSGQMVNSGKRSEVMKQLPSGVYIVNGKKVVVK